MKKILALVIALAFLVVIPMGCSKKEDTGRLADILDSGKITMATSPDFAPVEFIDLTKTGQESYVGSDISLAYYIANQLGVELVIEAMDFSAVQAAVTSGEVDMAISGFAYTEERAESMLLSDFYNVDDEGYQGILILKDDLGEFKTADDFSGKTVAVQTASLQYNLVTEQLPDDIVIEPISNLYDAVLMLINGKVDAIASASDTGEMICTNYDTLAMSDFQFEYTSEGNVLAVSKGEQALMDAINEILADVNEQDLYAGWTEEATALAEELGIET